MDYKFENGEIMNIPTIERPEDNRKLFKVNLPQTFDDYLSGNGEGMWACCSEKDQAKIDEDVAEGIIFVKLLNDSIYYPELEYGTIIPVELRGECRPVAIWDELDAKYSLDEIGILRVKKALLNR